MFDAPPPIPPSCTGGKALGGGARLSPAGQNRPALSLAPCGLPVAASSSASCLKPWPPTSGCPGNRTPSSPRKPVGSSTVRAQDTGDSWGPGRDSRTSQVCSRRPTQPDSCCSEAPRTRAQGHSAEGPSSVSFARPGNGMNCAAQNFGVYSNTAGLPSPPQWEPRAGLRGPTPADAPSKTPTSKSPGWLAQRAASPLP